MGIDSRECLHCCHHVYVWGSVRHAYWVLVESFLNEKDGASGEGRDAPTIGRKANAYLGVQALRPWRGARQTSRASC